MHHFALRKCIVAIGMIGGMALTGSGWASPMEHAVDTAGSIGPVGLAYGDHTLNSGLSTALEVDNYTFAGVAGDSFRLLLHTLTLGLDPSIVVRSSSGAILGSASCNGTNTFGSNVFCSTSLDQTLAQSGQFTINVSDLGSNEAGNYQLHLERYPPVDNWMGFKYAVAVDERLDHFTDIDSFAFNGVAGTGVRLTVASATLGLDPALRVWDPIGNEISSLGCNGTNTFGSSIMCISSVDLNLASSGVYKFSVSDTGYDELGDFRFQVSCLFGACPSPLDGAPIPSPIPEPETYALLMAGLGVIGMVVRRRQRRC